MPTSYEIIRQAIIDKHQILAHYHGHYREMCPHAIGTKNGRPQALCYQFAGTSDSGLGPDGSPDNWRCVIIADLINVTARSGEWHTSPYHSQRQTCVDRIDVEVDY